MTKTVIFKGRKKPYTLKGIKRVKCCCGGQAYSQWNCCANDNRWIPVCKECDIWLNQMILDVFVLDPSGMLINSYKKKVMSQ